jgi:hypothetical protein
VRASAAAADGLACGQRVALRVHSSAIVVTADAAGHDLVGSRGDLALPASARTLCGIDPGQNVVLAACASLGIVVIHPAATVAKAARAALCPERGPSEDEPDHSANASDVVPRPRFAILVVFFFLSTVFNLIYAFIDWSGFKAAINPVGFDNFADLASNGTLFRALRITIIYAALVALFQKLFGFASPCCSNETRGSTGWPASSSSFRSSCPRSPSATSSRPCSKRTAPQPAHRCHRRVPVRLRLARRHHVDHSSWSRSCTRGMDHGPSGAP